MRIIGVTGGIGSGKSTVCKVFSELGFPVYNADERAKRLMHSTTALIAQIQMEFGEESYQNGTLDRARMASIVFDDKEALAKLNSFVHPAVAKDFKEWCDAQSSRVVMKEAAILFEAGGYQQLDETVLVHAPEEDRIRRVCDRDGVTPEQVKARMKNQWTDDKKLSLADHVIENHIGHLIIPQLLKLVNGWNK